jgi:probable HAF family extracellular repeat protein
VVGASEFEITFENTHAFLYTSTTGMIDLNSLIDPLSGWELSDAADINEAGQITGQGLIGGEYHAYLLTPIPALPGDFDEDGQVDAADLAVWRLGFGISGVAAHTDGDADGDHDVDGADFLSWQRQLGSSAPIVPTGAVPEPSTVNLLVSAAVAAFSATGGCRKLIGMWHAP